MSWAGDPGMGHTRAVSRGALLPFLDRSDSESSGPEEDEEAIIRSIMMTTTAQVVSTKEASLVSKKKKSSPDMATGDSDACCVRGSVLAVKIRSRGVLPDFNDRDDSDEEVDLRQARLLGRKMSTHEEVRGHLVRGHPHPASFTPWTTHCRHHRHHTTNPPHYRHHLHHTTLHSPPTETEPSPSPRRNHQPMFYEIRLLPPSSSFIQRTRHAEPGASRHRPRTTYTPPHPRDFTGQQAHSE